MGSGLGDRDGPRGRGKISKSSGCVTGGWRTLRAVYIGGAAEGRDRHHRRTAAQAETQATAKSTKRYPSNDLLSASRARAEVARTLGSPRPAAYAAQQRKG